MLDRDQILAHLPDARLIGRKILVFSETSSTNDIALKLGQNGAEEGIVVFAEKQTAGRGTQGRKWHSAPGVSLCFSILLRPKLPYRDWQRLTPAVAVAMAFALERVSGLPLWIKWPNDLYLSGKKLCGVLTETRPGREQHSAYAVVGVGLNVNHLLEDWPAELCPRCTSLRMEVHRHFDRCEIAAALLSAIGHYYRYIENDFDAVISEFSKRNYLLSWRVASESQPSLNGVVCGISPGGELLVQQENGCVQSINAGVFKALQISLAGTSSSALAAST